MRDDGSPTSGCPRFPAVCVPFVDSDSECMSVNGYLRLGKMPVGEKAPVLCKMKLVFLQFKEG